MRGSQTLKRPWHATTQLHLLNFISHQGRAPRLLSALLSGIAGDAFYHPHIGKASIIIPEDTDSGLWSDLPKITQLVSGRSGTRNHNLWFLAQCPFHYTLIFFFFSFSFLSRIHFLATSHNCSQLWPQDCSQWCSQFQALARSADTWLSPNSSSILSSESSVPINPPGNMGPVWSEKTKPNFYVRYPGRWVSATN